MHDSEMASFEILHTQNSSADSFPSDEYSFLPEVGPVQNGDGSHIENSFNLSNMQSALVTTTPDLSIEEVHSRLMELLDENKSLKEALNKNNSMMKEQMRTISAWREQMILSKNQQQQSLQKAKEKISSLEKENVDLHEKMNSLKPMVLDHSSQDFCSKSCATVQTDEETGYEIVHQMAHQATAAANEFSMQTSVVPSEVEDLKKILEEKDKELHLQKKVEEELTEKIKLYEMKMQENEIALKAKFEILNNKLDIESSLTDKYKERSENLQQQINEYQEKLESAKMIDDYVVRQLREETKDLQEILKLEQQANQRDKDKLSEVMHKCEQLQVDYDRATKLLEIQSKDEKKRNEEFFTQRETDAKRHLEEMDHLTARILDLEEKLEEKTDEVRRLTEELRACTSAKEDAERIPILEAQVDVYKTDIENLMVAKDATLEENEKLQNELKKYQNKQESGTRKKSGRSPVRKDTGDWPILCPVCSKGFTDARTAENHANRCMDNGGF